MSLTSFIEVMPKVELHVHMEGSIRPATLLKLARRHGVPLPADSVEGLRRWYSFTDFGHFIEVYLTIADCIRTADDVELLAREFLEGQAAQNVLYTEATYTAIRQWQVNHIPFADQLAAINRARTWAAESLGVEMALVLDIPRDMTVEDGELVADWAIANHGDGVAALGLAGPEAGFPGDEFAPVFERARAAGLPRVPHAGEHGGADSIWRALRVFHADRIGHGVRCLEDPTLVAELRDRQVPLEVSPSSNVCLGVATDWPSHPLRRLLDAGLYVTLNSDDPPMFDTTLTREYLMTAQSFGFGPDRLEQLVLNAARASLLPPDRRAALEARCQAEFARLATEHLAAG